MRMIKIVCQNFYFEFWSFDIVASVRLGGDFGFHASDFYDYHYIKKIIFSRFALVESVEIPLVLICPLNLKHQQYIRVRAGK